MKKTPRIVIDEDYFDRSGMGPEQALAVEVIVQAFRDVQWFASSPKRPSDPNKLAIWQLARLNAFDAAQFLSGGDALDYWCQIAGIHSDVSALALRQCPQLKTIVTRRDHA